MAQPTAHRPAQPHGELEQVFDNIWNVTGTYPMGPGLRIPRNMTIVREGDRLVLLNAIRLTAGGEAALDKLGKVTDVVRLSFGHGSDDPYLKERYDATMWAPAGLKKQGIEYRDLSPAPGASPLADGTPFLFEKGSTPDAAILIAREGGILVSCDAYQHWTGWSHGSLLGRVATSIMGFRGPVIGGPWAKRMGPGVHADLVRLREQPFKHLLTGHGTPLRDRARDELAGAMERRFKR